MFLETTHTYIDTYMNVSTRVNTCETMKMSRVFVSCQHLKESGRVTVVGELPQYHVGNRDDVPMTMTSAIRSLLTSG